MAVPTISLSRATNGDGVARKAVERVRHTHVGIDGFWIDASDRGLPENFGDIARDVLEAYADA